MEKELVSVLIITYRSKETVVETLDSVINQDYAPIELIIADDGSTDGTKEVIEGWIQQNKNKISNIIFVNHKDNMGISENTRSGLRAASGKWIKILGGDDILKPDCISFYMNNLGDEKVYISEIERFSTDYNGEKIVIKHIYNPRLKKLNSMTAEQQYRYFLRKFEFSSPTMFIDRQMQLDLGEFDDIAKSLDDWPLILRITESGYRVRYYPRTTIRYRMGNSISQSTDKMYNERHWNNVQAFKEQYCYPNIPKLDVLYYYEELVLKIRYFIIVKLLHNKCSKRNYIINKVLTALLPTNWKYAVLKIKGER